MFNNAHFSRSVPLLHVIGGFVFGFILVIAAPIDVHLPTQPEIQTFSISTAHAGLLVDVGLPWQLGGVTVCGTSVTDVHRCTLADVTPDCLKKDNPTCTPDDRTILALIAECANGGTSVGCSDTQIQQALQDQSLVTYSCSGFEDFWKNPTICVGRTLSAFIGTVLITATAWLLAVAGLLFDFIVNKTIVEFGAFFNNSLKAGIDTGWTAFRDIANIVIIGMFPF